MLTQENDKILELMVDRYTFDYGCLDEVEIYLVLAFGLMNGLLESLLRSMTTPKKSTHLKLHSVFILRSSLPCRPHVLHHHDTIVSVDAKEELFELHHELAD